MNSRYYEEQLIQAKISYHKNCAEVLTNAIHNQNDPDEKQRLYARRSWHRKAMRKYMAMLPR